MTKNKYYYGFLDRLYPYIKGKKVLDIGCIDHDLRKKNSPLWVHGFLSKHSKVKGIDILKKEINDLRKEGYDVYCKNAENFEFDEEFDVIVAGELIEHLGNPGLFLNQCKKHLKKGGLLILTTPNTFNPYENIKNVVLLRNNPPVNSEHTCYYTPNTIKELLKRYKFKDVKIDYFDFYGSSIGKIRYNILNLMGNKFKRRMIVFTK